MKAIFLTFPLLLSPVVAVAQNDLVPPQVVRFESVRIDREIKLVRVGNSQQHYTLFCNVKAEGCITPERGTNYLQFDSGTRWKMPGAKGFITLAFIQDWTVKYSQGENIGLVAEAGSGANPPGMFILDDGQQATIFADGPIIYGAGMSNQDRQRAWKVFFMKMVEAVARQQGQDALGVKLARRCLPGEDFCTMALDANLVVVGGASEPRKVLL